MSYWTLEGLSPALFGDAKLRSRGDAAWAAMSVALRTMVTRRDLVELDERALADVGLTRAEALSEARRTPWDLHQPRRPQRPDQPKPQVRGKVVAWLDEALRRRRSRQSIGHLNAWMLKDIGVSFAEAEHEANKPFWRG
jgi:uncharacterized protein YjiS (DUF1127 family)